ncbi:uncharacterized protein PRCAT00000262001 [Priceomyces carsonii]|uniref:uncharacterized protein n=1 Tax=Priceomyces carsonii TaxID=28549 RepID=UPI002ED7F214|nr:unnamed protein product [Priceomyces carsonii]
MDSLLTTTANGPISVKTSREWVLPPRPKPGRKPTEVPKNRKRKLAQKPASKLIPSNSPMAANNSNSWCASSNNNNSNNNSNKSRNHNNSTSQLMRTENCQKECNLGATTIEKNIEVIERENGQLKNHLLSLIHDYKSLKNMVLNKPSHPVQVEYDGISGARKRAFAELNDPMNELITDMNELSHDTPAFDDSEASPEAEDFLSFIDYDRVSDHELEEDDELIDSPALSRTTSPSSDTENSLMSSLTRSTTVSTYNSNIERKNFKFHDLPVYSNEDYTFTFDQESNKKYMSIIEEDKYNMVTDFLEEKLISNDLNYYELQQQNI